MQANRKQQGGPAIEPEATLFQHAQGGCRQSLNLLMSRHEGLVHAVIHEQYLYGLPRMRKPCKQAAAPCGEQSWAMNQSSGRHFPPTPGSLLFERCGWKSSGAEG